MEWLKSKMDTCNRHCTRRVWVFVLSMLIVLDSFFHIFVYYNILQSPERRRRNALWNTKNVTVYYKYPLVNGSKASMDYKIGYNSSYYWFTSMKHLFKDLSADAAPRRSRNIPMCQLNTSLEPIFVNKSEPELDWIEEQNIDVTVGGYYSPANCRPINRVAIIIPYRFYFYICNPYGVHNKRAFYEYVSIWRRRERPVNLLILLSYLHPLLKKQLLEYRIFVIEQYGSEKFNKGTLYNIAFLETQRFGTWNCLIFHDVDLVPEDERISYSCPEHPTHMSSFNDSWGENDLRSTSFGGVTAITPEHYEAVNGYSNLFWDWGVEDDDFYGRLESKNYTIDKYNSSMARYAVLAHPGNGGDKKRTLLLTASRMRFRRDDLRSTRYNIVNVTEEKLYTYILADVNPTNMPLDSKSLMQRLFYFNGKTFYGHEEFIS